MTRHRAWYQFSRENLTSNKNIERCPICKVKFNTNDKESDGFRSLVAPKYRKKAEQK